MTGEEKTCKDRTSTFFLLHCCSFTWYDGVKKIVFILFYVLPLKGHLREKKNN